MSTVLRSSAQWSPTLASAVPSTYKTTSKNRRSANLWTRCRQGLEPFGAMIPRPSVLELTGASKWSLIETLTGERNWSRNLLSSSGWAMDQCSQIVLGSDSSSVNQTNSRHCRSYQGCYRFSPEHNVYFIQYDAPVSFMTLYTIQPEEGVDTGAYFRGNHGSGV